MNGKSLVVLWLGGSIGGPTVTLSHVIGQDTLPSDC